MSQDFEGLELAEAIRSLRDNLLEAAAQGVDKSIRFAVESVELELAVELRSDVIGKAGVKAWVVAANTEASRGRVGTHRVKVTLSPRDVETGLALEIGNTDRGGIAGFGPIPQPGGSGS